MKKFIMDIWHLLIAGVALFWVGYALSAGAFAAAKHFDVEIVIAYKNMDQVTK